MRAGLGCRNYLHRGIGSLRPILHDEPPQSITDERFNETRFVHARHGGMDAEPADRIAGEVERRLLLLTGRRLCRLAGGSTTRLRWRVGGGDLHDIRSGSEAGVTQGGPVLRARAALLFSGRTASHLHPHASKSTWWQTPPDSLAPRRRPRQARESPPPPEPRLHVDGPGRGGGNGSGNAAQETGDHVPKVTGQIFLRFPPWCDRVHCSHPMGNAYNVGDGRGIRGYRRQVVVAPCGGGGGNDSPTLREGIPRVRVGPSRFEELSLVAGVSPSVGRG